MMSEKGKRKKIQRKIRTYYGLTSNYSSQPTAYGGV